MNEHIIHILTQSMGNPEFPSISGTRDVDGSTPITDKSILQDEDTLKDTFGQYIDSDVVAQLTEIDLQKMQNVLANNITLDKLSLNFPSVEQSFEEWKVKLHHKKTSPIPFTSTIRKYKYWILFILFCLMSILLYYTVIRTKTISNFSPQPLDVQLADGSQVKLNKGSSIEFSDFRWEKNRMLILSGQAFFSVKKGEKFTVKTTMGEVIVLGTKFDVLTSANVMVVGCHEGKVRVSNEKESVIIEKGEGVQLAVNGYMNRFEVEDIEPKWINGIEQFNDVPLYKVIEQMRRYFNIHHVCTSDELYRKFNGTLSTTNPQELTNVLAPVMNISCRIENNDIYMCYK